MTSQYRTTMKNHSHWLLDPAWFAHMEGPSVSYLVPGRSAREEGCDERCLSLPYHSGARTGRLLPFGEECMPCPSQHVRKAIRI